MIKCFEIKQSPRQAKSNRYCWFYLPNLPFMGKTKKKSLKTQENKSEMSLFLYMTVNFQGAFSHV